MPAAARVALWGSWGRVGGRLLLGPMGCHVTTVLQGLGRHLHSIFLVCLRRVVSGSFSLAVLVLLVSTSAHERSWKSITVRPQSGDSGDFGQDCSVNNPNEQSSCSCWRILQAVLCEDGVLCIVRGAQSVRGWPW